MWKRFWAMILVMTIVITQIPINSYASETGLEETGEMQTSGTVGENNQITWNYDEMTQTMVLSGSDSFGTTGAYFGDAISTGVRSVTKNIRVNNFAVSGTMQYMFTGFVDTICIDLTSLDMTKVTEMIGLFYGCSALETVNLGGLDMTNITDVSNMFDGCINLQTIYTPNAIAEGVTIALPYTFIDGSGNEVTEISSANCNQTLTRYETGTFGDTNGITWTFYNGVMTVTGKDSFSDSAAWADKVDVSIREATKSVVVNDLTISGTAIAMFMNFENVTDITFNNIDTKDVTNMSSMFNGCSNLQSLDLSSFDTSQLADMSSLFEGCTSLSSVDLSSFDTSQLADMSSLFEGCTSLSSVDLSSFDTRGVERMNDVFTGCKNLLTVHTPSEMLEEQSIGLPYAFVDETFKEVNAVTMEYTKQVLKKNVIIEALSFDKTEAELEKGETLQLTAVITPENATNQTLIWTSSDETIATVTQEGLVTAVEAGTAEIIVTAQDGSGLSSSCILTITVPPATEPVITAITPTNAVYGYAEGETSVTIVAEEVEGHTYTYQWYSNTENKNSGGTPIADAVSVVYTLPVGMDAGEYYYYCEIKATRTDNQQTTVATSDTAAVVIEKKTLTEAMVSLDFDGEYEYTGNAITPVVTVTDSLKLAEGTDYELTGDVSQTAYGTYSIGVEGTGNYSGTVSASWSIKDTTVPSGKIEIGTDYWNTFLNIITFDKFYKKTQSVTITGEDGTDQSGVDRIYYILSSTQIAETELEDLEWTEYNGSFSINPNNEYIIYAKITDVAGNMTYLSSEGLVLDSTAPVIGGVIDGTTYCGDTVFTVTETYLDKVTVNGEEVTLTDGSYTLSGDKTEYTVTATDKSGNSTTVTVIVNNDHSWLEATCTEEKTCSVCGEVEGEALGHSWSEEWSKDEENHWHICNNSDCTEIADMSAHADGTDADYACDECGYICYIQELSLDNTEVELENGETLQLTAIITPTEATNQILTWTSSDEKIATVTQEGLVTAVGVGEVTITATAQDGSNLSVSCIITVVWENILESCIKYDFAGGEINGELEVSEIYKQQAVDEIGFKQPVLAEIPTKAGFTFLGWELTEGEGGTYDAQTGEITGNYGTNYTLTAQWEEIVIEPVEIQSGEVEMQVGVPYKLAEGNWKIEGDDTVYSGGQTVYVSESGTYCLTEQISSEDEITTETETTMETEVTTETE